MEEDIKVLEEILNRQIEDTEGTKIMKRAITNLIKGYKELEEKNKKQKEHITNINKRHTNLREQLKLLQTHRLRKYVMSNYIEKSKVAEILKKKKVETDIKALDWDAMYVLDELEEELLGKKLNT